MDGYYLWSHVLSAMPNIPKLLLSNLICQLHACVQFYMCALGDRYVPNFRSSLTGLSLILLFHGCHAVFFKTCLAATTSS